LSPAAQPKEIGDLIAAGKVQVVLSETCPLKQVVQARTCLRPVTWPVTWGKMVLTVQ
jgi:hypothetical protein